MTSTLRNTNFQDFLDLHCFQSRSSLSTLYIILYSYSTPSTKCDHMEDGNIPREVTPLTKFQQCLYANSGWRHSQARGSHLVFLGDEGGDIVNHQPVRNFVACRSAVLLVVDRELHLQPIWTQTVGLLSATKVTACTG